MVVSTKRKNSLKSKSNSKTRKQFKKFRKSGMKTKKMRGGGKGFKVFKGKVSDFFRKSSSKKDVVSSTPVKSSVLKASVDNDIARILGKRPTLVKSSVAPKTETIEEMLKRIGVKSNSNPKNNPNQFMAKRLVKEAELAESTKLTPEQRKAMEEQEEQQRQYLLPDLRPK